MLLYSGNSAIHVSELYLALYLSPIHALFLEESPVLQISCNPFKRYYFYIAENGIHIYVLH